MIVVIGVVTIISFSIITSTIIIVFVIVHREELK